MRATRPGRAGSISSTADSSPGPDQGPTAVGTRPVDRDKQQPRRRRRGRDRPAEAAPAGGRVRGAHRDASGFPGPPPRRRPSRPPARRPRPRTPAPRATGRPARVLPARPSAGPLRRADPSHRHHRVRVREPQFRDPARLGRGMRAGRHGERGDRRRLEPGPACTGPWRTAPPPRVGAGQGAAAAAPKPSSGVVELELVCGRPGRQDRGEQVLGCRRPGRLLADPPQRRLAQRQVGQRVAAGGDLAGRTAGPTARRTPRRWAAASTSPDGTSAAAATLATSRPSRAWARCTITSPASGGGRDELLVARCPPRPPRRPQHLAQPPAHGLPGAELGRRGPGRTASARTPGWPARWPGPGRRAGLISSREPLDEPERVLPGPGVERRPGRAAGRSPRRPGRPACQCAEPRSAARRAGSTPRPPTATSGCGLASRPAASRAAVSDVAAEHVGQGLRGRPRGWPGRTAPAAARRPAARPRGGRARRRRAAAGHTRRRHARRAICGCQSSRSHCAARRGADGGQRIRVTRVRRPVDWSASERRTRRRGCADHENSRRAGRRFRPGSLRGAPVRGRPGARRAGRTGRTVRPTPSRGWSGT